MDPADEPGLETSSEWAYICHELGIPEHRVIPFMQQWHQAYYEYQYFSATLAAKQHRERELRRELSPLAAELARFDATLQARLTDDVGIHLDVPAAARRLADQRVGLARRVAVLDSAVRALSCASARDAEHCADAVRAEHSASAYFRLMQDTHALLQLPADYHTRRTPARLAARYAALGMPVPRPTEHRPWSHRGFPTHRYRLWHEAAHAAALAPV